MRPVLLLSNASKTLVTRLVHVPNIKLPVGYRYHNPNKKFYCGIIENHHSCEVLVTGMSLEHFEYHNKQVPPSSSLSSIKSTSTATPVLKEVSNTPARSKTRLASTKRKKVVDSDPTVGAPSQFRESTKVSRLQKKLESKYNKAKKAKKADLTSHTLCSPGRAVQLLQNAQLRFPAVGGQSKLSVYQQFRGYLSSSLHSQARSMSHSRSTSSRLWNESSSVPEGMSRDEIWSLHDLSENLELESNVFYLSSSPSSSGNNTITLSEEDSSILEMTVHENMNASNSFSDDLLVTETIQLNTGIIETINSDEFSEIDDQGLMSDSDSESIYSAKTSSVPETPQYEQDDLLLESDTTAVPETPPIYNEIPLAAEASRLESERNINKTYIPETPQQTTEDLIFSNQHNEEQNNNEQHSIDYTRLKMAELRQIAKSKGLKGGKTKQGLIDMLLGHNSENTVTAAVKEMEYELTETLKTTLIGKPWWESILSYEPILIEDFYAFVQTKLLIKLTLPQLKQYCDANGVCFTTTEEWNIKK